MQEFHHFNNTLEEILKKLSRLELATYQKEAPFLTIDQVTKYTGIPKQTIYQYTSKGRIPFYKLNDRRLYFSKTDIDNFILSRSNRHKSNAEIESEAITRIVTER